MNCKNLFKSLILISCGIIALNAQESGILTKTMKGAPEGKVESKAPQKSTPFLGDNDHRDNKGIEFRIGPVVNAYNDVAIQSSPRGQSFDLEQLDFEDPTFGAKIDFDWEFAPRIHFNNAVTWIQYKQEGRTTRDLTFGSGMKLLSGSLLEADMNIFKYEPKIGYDVYRNDSFRLMPYLGGVFVVADGEVKARSGSVQREQGKISTIDREKVYSKTEVFGTYVLGFEANLYLTRKFYMGADLGGYYLGELYGANGKGYVGYDFNEKLSLRLGTDINYINLATRGIEAQGYSNTAFAQIGVKF